MDAGCADAAQRRRDAAGDRDDGRPRRFRDRLREGRQRRPLARPRPVRPGQPAVAANLRHRRADHHLPLRSGSPVRAGRSARDSQLSTHLTERVTLARQWTSRADRPQPSSCPSPGNSSRPRPSSRSSPERKRAPAGQAADRGEHGGGAGSSHSSLEALAGSAGAVGAEPAQSERSVCRRLRYQYSASRPAVSIASPLTVD